MSNITEYGVLRLAVGSAALLTLQLSVWERLGLAFDQCGVHRTQDSDSDSDSALNRQLQRRASYRVQSNEDGLPERWTMFGSACPFRLLLVVLHPHPLLPTGTSATVTPSARLGIPTAAQAALHTFFSHPLLLCHQLCPRRLVTLGQGCRRVHALLKVKLD
jgi:hypothetical protein